MKIHGKNLEQTNDGDGIYYDNIKITDKRTGLNENMSFYDWKKLIEKDENFDPKKYNPYFFKDKV